MMTSAPWKECTHELSYCSYVSFFVVISPQPTRGSLQQSTPRWGRPWGTLYPVTCSAPWPVVGKPVNMRTPLAGVMRSKPWKDSTRPGTLASRTTTFSPSACTCFSSQCCARLARVTKVNIGSHMKSQYICPGFCFALWCVFKIESLNKWDLWFQCIDMFVGSLYVYWFKGLRVVCNLLNSPNLTLFFSFPQLPLTCHILHLQDYWQLASYGKAFHWNHREI